MVMFLDTHWMDIVPYTDATDSLWITEFAFYIVRFAHYAYYFLFGYFGQCSLYARDDDSWWKHDPEFTRVAISSFV